MAPRDLHEHGPEFITFSVVSGCSDDSFDTSAGNIVAH